MDAFCSGARLHRISEIYDDDYPEIECDLHASYQQIIHSRPAYEAAVSAASWEEWELRRGGDWEPFRDVGIHMRRFVYSVCQPLLPAAPPARRQRSVSPALAPPSPPVEQVVSLDEYARHPLPGGAASSRAHFSARSPGPQAALRASPGQPSPAPLRSHRRPPRRPSDGAHPRDLRPPAQPRRHGAAGAGAALTHSLARLLPAAS